MHVRSTYRPCTWERTCYTSVSLDPDKVRDFGDVLWQVRRPKLEADGHKLVEHEQLLDALRNAIRTTDKAERLRSVQALRYARRRLEGLIDWKFKNSSTPTKDLLAWAVPPPIFWTVG